MSLITKGFFFFLIALTSTTAYSQSIVDQSYDREEWGGGHSSSLVQDARTWGQSFTVGRSGMLTQIDFTVRAIDYEDDIEVSLFHTRENGSPNLPLGPILTVTVPVIFGESAYNYTSADLSQFRFFVSEGEQYVFYVASLSDTRFGILGGVHYEDGMTFNGPGYLGGSMWRYSSQSGGSYNGRNYSTDVNFRTYVDASQVPPVTPETQVFSGSAQGYEEITYQVDVNSDLINFNLSSTLEGSSLMLFVYDSSGGLLAADYWSLNAIELEADISSAVGPFDVVVYNNSATDTPFELELNYLPSNASPTPVPTPLPGVLPELPELPVGYQAEDFEGELSMHEERSFTMDLIDASEIIIDAVHDGDDGAVWLFLYNEADEIVVFHNGTGRVETETFGGENLTGTYKAVIYNSTGSTIYVHARAAHD